MTHKPRDWGYKRRRISTLLSFRNALKVGTFPDLIKLFMKGDDDDYDCKNETENENEMYSHNLWMGFGGFNANKKPIYEIKDIGVYLRQCGYKKDTDGIME